MNNGRASIENTLGTYKLTIPVKRNNFAVAFLVFWLFGWVFGITTALLNLDMSDNPEGALFMRVWLVGWTFGGIAVIAILSWILFGKETFEINRKEIQFNKTLFGIGIKKTLVKHEVKNFRFEKIEEGIIGGKMNKSYLGLGPGKIRFDYGFRTYSFGLGVDDVEALYLVDELTKKIAQ